MTFEEIVPSIEAQFKSLIEWFFLYNVKHTLNECGTVVVQL